MNKKVTSWLLVFVMLFSVMVSVMPSYSASSNEFTITPDKSEVYPGDTITYTVVLGPIENFQSANFTLIIPDGLTFVSGTTPEGLKELTGATEAGFENSTLTFYHGGLESYTSDTDTVLMTFTCTVNSDAMGDYQIDIMDDWDFADSNWTTYSNMVINTAASKITVVQKPVPATGIVLNKETLTIKVGESETLIVTLTPENVTDTVVWTSSNENVATVDNSGKVTAIAKGNAIITAKAGDVSAICKVTTECAHINTTKHPANESTCTEQGNDAYTTCDDCGDVISGSDEKLPIDPENHVNTITYPAETGSCVNPGHAEYSFCNDCKSIISGSDSPVIGPHGTYVEKAEEKYLKTVADCENAAVYYKSCELCGEAHAIETFTYGDALGHDYSEATCTLPKTCKVCGNTEGEALGHSYAIAWSKGEDGHWHECSVCGDKKDFASHDYSDEGDSCVICEYERAHVHRLTLVPANDVTCITDGNKAYYTCSGCEDWFEDASGAIVISDKTSVVISALGHNLSDATCTEAAMCQREECNYIEGTALGHSFTNYVSNNDVTCTVDGTKTAICDRCDETDTVIDAGSAKGHDYADATCTAPKTCKVCGVTEGEALGHSYATVWSKGEEGHWHECSVCGDKTDFVAHDYGTEGDTCLICGYERAHVHRLTLIPGVDATCTDSGSKPYYICSGCEDWFEDAYGTVVISDKTSVIIAALGHDLADATCTAAAMCQREGCNYTEGDALGHNYEDGWTCDAENHWHKCSRCDAKAGEEAHTTGEEATEETSQICTICNYEITPALGHTHKLTKVEATVTCTEAGNKAYYTCECGKWFADAEATIEIADRDSVKSDALGHTDENKDSKCDICGIKLENDQPTASDKTTDGVPQTSDNNSTVLWATLLILSFMYVIFSKKRNNV